MKPSSGVLIIRLSERVNLRVCTQVVDEGPCGRALGTAAAPGETDSGVEVRVEGKSGEARVRVSGEDGGGDDGGAEAGVREADEHVRVAGFKHDSWLYPCGDECGSKEFANGRAGAGRDQWCVGECGDRYPRVTLRRFDGENCDEGVADELNNADVFTDGKLHESKERRVDVPLVQGGDEVRGRVLMKGDIDAGVFVMEDGEKTREVERRGIDRPNAEAEMASDQASERVNASGTRSGRIQSGSGIGQERLASGGEDDGTAGTVQKRLTEFAFQLADLSADPGWETCNLSAARVKLCSSATAIRYRR